MTRQDEQANRIYYEPRCHEGNYGLPALLLGARLDERAFAEGQGPGSGDARTRRRDFGNPKAAVDALTGARRASMRSVDRDLRWAADRGRRALVSAAVGAVIDVA